MKKALLFIALSCVFFSSCQKSNIDTFRGDYSFKTSGSVTIQRQANDSVEAATFTLVLPNDIGQLEIVTLDKSQDSVIVIMNHLNGEVTLTHGHCGDGQLVLNEFQRDNIEFNLDQVNFKAPVKIKAVGHCYDGNTLLFNMTYRGKAEVDQLSYTIEGDDIRMVAYRN